MNIAIIAHDKKKELAVQFCIAYCGILAKHTLCATGTTGKLVAEATGLKVERYLAGQQGGEQQFNMMMMMQTRQMLVQGYALDALFRHEGLVVSDEDVQEACAAMNPQNPQGVRRQMEESGRGFALREAAERIKANKWLLEHADITVKDPNEAPAAE